MVQNKIKRTPGRPRQFDQDETLDKAINVFWQLGYDAADTQTLSEKTGLSKPSLYNAFGSKEDIFVAALVRYQSLRREAMCEALDRSEVPFEGIRCFFEVVAQNAAGEDHPKGCLINSMAIPLRDRLPKVSNFFSEIKDQPDFKVEYFENMIRNGHLPSNFNIAAATALMRDFSFAMFSAGRAGAPFDILKGKADRYANLVLLEGNGIVFDEAPQAS